MLDRGVPPLPDADELRWLILGMSDGEADRIYSMAGGEVLAATAHIACVAKGGVGHGCARDLATPIEQCAEAGARLVPSG